MSQQPAFYLDLRACSGCKTCPVSAIARDERGLVRIDASRCIGCGRCRRSCPYDAPQLDSERKKMTKCDGCAERLGQGLSPLCVAACPMRALDFGDYESLRGKYGEAAHVAPLPDPALTRPGLLLSAHPNGQPVGSALGALANPEEL